MLFLNKKTGLQWEISDNEHQNRLKNDPDYEAIEVIPEEQNSNLNLDALGYKELQSIAKEKGLKHTGIKKEELLESLYKLFAEEGE